MAQLRTPMNIAPADDPVYRDGTVHVLPDLNFWHVPLLIDCIEATHTACRAQPSTHIPPTHMPCLPIHTAPGWGPCLQKVPVGGPLGGETPCPPSLQGLPQTRDAVAEARHAGALPAVLR